MLDAKVRGEITTKLIGARKAQKLWIDGLQDAKRSYAKRAMAMAEDTAIDARRFEEGLRDGRHCLEVCQRNINTLETRIQKYERALGPDEDKVDENLK